MNFFTGFKWAVPSAFAEAVSLYRFEEGDMLYDTQLAYQGSWEQACRHIGYSLQIRHPARGITSITDAWNSELRLNLFLNQESVNIGQIQSTQGRLYSTLWKGDIESLYMHTPEPPQPITAQELTKRLDEITLPESIKTLNAQSLFIMATDQAEAMMRKKYQAVNSALTQYMHVPPYLLGPHDTGLNEPCKIAPTASIACFATQLTTQTLHTIIKSALYKPINSESKRFRIQSHGLIL